MNTNAIVVVRQAIDVSAWIAFPRVGRQGEAQQQRQAFIATGTLWRTLPVTFL